MKENESRLPFGSVESSLPRPSVWSRLAPTPSMAREPSSPERAGPPHHRCCHVSPSVPPQGPARKARKKEKNKKTTTRRGRRRRRRQRAESPQRTENRPVFRTEHRALKTEHRALRTASLRTDSSQLTRLEEGEAPRAPARVRPL